jgi:uncharacterized phage protein gp47/JayE
MATGFKVKTMNQIEASMVNWFASVQSFVTDLNVGSVARTLLQAVASELAEIYYRIYNGILEAQETAVYTSFDFPKLSATSSAGVVLWQTSALPLTPITISVGSQAAVPATNVTAEATFSSTATVVIPAKTTLNGGINNSVTSAIVTSAANMAVGDYLQIDSEKMKITSIAVNTLGLLRAQLGTAAASHSNGADAGIVAKAVTMTADIAGLAGNVSALTVSKINTPITGIATVTNLAAFNGGLDEETDDARKTRFQTYVSALARGTKPAIEFGAKTVTGCVKARAFDLDDDISIPTGTVKLYIADSAGTADSTLITNVNLAIEAYKPAGAAVITAAPAIVSVAVTAVLTVAAGYNKDTIVTQVKQTITDFITGLSMGDDVYISKLHQKIIDTNAAAISFVTMTLPAGDVAITNSQIARPGTLTITAV